MKRVILSVLMMTALASFAQEKNTDTTKINLGESEIWIIKKPGAKTDDANPMDTVSAAPNPDDEEDDGNSHEGHWAGVDFGAMMLMNNQMKSSFPNAPFLENDPAKSFYWNINFMDHRFNLYKEYVGITTGFGINWTQIGIKDNQMLYANSDSLWVVPDTVNKYSKNKLRATYLQIPLLLEFNTNEDEDKSFYVAAGVIGGIRVGSALVQKVDRENFDGKEKTKGTYGLNPFKCDATVRLGYNDFGLFANYALLPLFDTDKTSEAYPLTFGLTMNF